MIELIVECLRYTWYAVLLFLFVTIMIPSVIGLYDTYFIFKEFGQVTPEEDKDET